MLKVYEFTYDLICGVGRGIIIAESEEDATNMLKESNHDSLYVYYSCPKLTFREIDITKPQVIDYSWQE